MQFTKGNKDKLGTQFTVGISPLFVARNMDEGAAPGVTSYIVINEDHSSIIELSDGSLLTTNP